ncbi:MAG: T9SS type A sorting domain-containing protein [Lewinellaceae bacterium]|nr:T9SS type A sorting domain-containing protein [Lewinellaceae bacterium]
MNRRLLLYRLPTILFLNLLFFAGVWANSPTFLWIGGFSNNWEDPQNWVDMDSGLGNQLPTAIADVMIDGNVTVTLSSNFLTGSIQISGGATLIIAVGATLSTTEGGLNGSHGIRLDQTSPNTGYPAYINGSNSGPSALIVNGHLVINDPIDPNIAAPGVGLYIAQYTSVTVGNAGSIAIYNAVDEGINVKGSMVNNGAISIISPNLAGITTSGAVSGSIITNNGTLTVSGGTIGINLGSVFMYNYGTVTLSGASGKILAGDGEFYNYGTLGGNGTVESDMDFKPQPGSIISPGASIGTLTFENGLNLSGVTLFIEINASNSYDRIIVQGPAALNGGNLSFGGTYSPLSGQDYLVVHSTTNQISGKFSSPTESEPVTLNSATFNISYTGNMAADADILVTNSSVLPVELTYFTARPAGKAVQLSWGTATETNNDYFSVEHSADGRHFTEIGRLSGFGTSQEKHEYAFVDPTPDKGLNYYRLGQYDFDGAYEYSQIQTVVFKGGDSWTIRPTLASEVVLIEWPEGPAGNNAAVEVFNLSGQKVFGQEAPAQPAALPIPVADWAPGMYWVAVRSHGKVETQRFVKE